MTEKLPSADDAARRDGSRLSEGLGPLPEGAGYVDRGAPYSGDQEPGARYTSDQMRAYAAQEVAAERGRCADGNDLEAMCEAFHRLIEAHANLRSPFHQPVCADAQMALRVLRGIVAALRA